MPDAHTPDDRKPLDRQVLVITGASNGIGLATADAALRHGARVVLCARSTKVLDHLVDGVPGARARALVLAADGLGAERMHAVAQAAAERFGGIDSWINTCGIPLIVGFDEPGVDIWADSGRRLFETAFWSMVNGSLAALPHLDRDGGTLVNLSDGVPAVPMAARCVHLAARQAVRGFCACLRDDLVAVRSPVVALLLEPVPAVPLAGAGPLVSGRQRTAYPRCDPHASATAILDAVAPIAERPATPSRSPAMTVRPPAANLSLV